MDFNPVCPYCEQPAELKDSSIIYGKSYGDVWICRNYPECDAYVGVHKGTSRPLGRMANAVLRHWKKVAHSKFDPIWKTGLTRRSFAYQLLAETMNIPAEKCHIGLFDVDQCKQVVLICAVIKEKIKCR